MCILLWPSKQRVNEMHFVMSVVTVDSSDLNAKNVNEPLF